MKYTKHTKTRTELRFPAGALLSPTGARPEFRSSRFVALLTAIRFGASFVWFN
jgi:hypothetical protein